MHGPADFCMSFFAKNTTTMTEGNSACITHEILYPLALFLAHVWITIFSLIRRQPALLMRGRVEITAPFTTHFARKNDYLHYPHSYHNTFLTFF